MKISYQQNFGDKEYYLNQQADLIQWSTLEIYVNYLVEEVERNIKILNLKNLYFNINKDKVQKYSIALFGNDDSTNTGFHDARYDTTSMFVAFHVYQDSLYNKSDWANMFCSI